MAFVDIGIFFLSFLVFFGPHGPIGPMVVLRLNYPGVAVVAWAFERLGLGDSSDLIGLVASVVAVGLSGYLYGFLFEAGRGLRRR